ncbi:MAG TPA: FecR domain-containing protein [Polyangiaceae bacterium]|jgi:ferric-dicitrate binding protein FerR (iron transport regulator)
MAPDPAEAWLRELAEEEIPAEDAATIERRKRRVVEATTRAIAREAKKRALRQRWERIAGGVAAAAAVMAGVGIWRARAHAPEAGGHPAPVALGEPLVGALHRTHDGADLPTGVAQSPLGAGDEVTTDPKGRAQVVLTDGVAMTLESNTRLRLPDAPIDGTLAAREVVGLRSGAVSVHVPPMPPGHTFSVKTADAEITVHGTAFTVEVATPDGASPSGEGATPATRVRVSTGVVSVASGGHESFLTAGMEWSSPAESKVLPPARVAALPPPPAESAGAPKAAPHPPRRDDPTPRSRLGEENQLLSSAIAASRSGDYAGAVATLNDLLRRFPSTTLAQEAHVERFRALAHAGDSAAAAREARQYLALYPDGFAREEAKALAVTW